MPIYDLVIQGGVVLLPELNKEEKLNIGISHGVIVRLSSDEMEAKEKIDASGSYVCRGFIDSHMHDDE